MIWPIYIPSKGRAGKSKLITQLLDEGFKDVHVFVEKEDVEAYTEAYDIIPFELAESNQGIAYVRNAILERARDTGLEWYWMFDDDIAGFYVARDGKTIKTSATQVLMQAQALIERQPDVAQAALEYQQFAWSQTNPMKFNSYCDVAVAINSQKLQTISYRGHLNLKEDRDFTLQVLSMGFRTMRCSTLAFSAPKNGSNKGGLYDVYAQTGREAAASQKMCEVWPGICTPVTKKDGRKDVKINWGFFKPAAAKGSK